jgi:hypothetical protein
LDKTIIVRFLRDESLQMVYQGRKLKWQQLPEEAPQVKDAEKQPSPTKRQILGRAGANSPWRKKKGLA